MIVTFYKPSKYMTEATDQFYTDLSTDAVMVYGITDLYVSGKVVVLKDDDNNQAVIDKRLYTYFDCV